MAKILVVDDEPLSTRVLSLTLTKHGHQVNTAASGESAITIGNEFLPDVLVCDWKLEGALDGIEVAQALQGAQQDLLVFLLSGMPSDFLEERIADVRVSRILEKPCEAEDIAKLVQEALAER